MTVTLYHYFSYFASALIISLVGVPIVRQIALKIDAVDRTGGRRVHDGVVPRLGGVGIYAAFCVPLVTSLATQEMGEIQFKILGILVGSTIVFLGGVVDDVKGTTVGQKLLFQCVGALVVYFWGVQIDLLSNPFGETIHLGFFSLPATVIYILVVTNAMNLIDGLDGLAAGAGVMIGCTLLALSGPKEFQVKVALVILIGSLLGFLRHNFPPATIFMGDSGSLFLGFFLGSFTIISSFKAASAMTILVPVLAFWHPILDMTYAVLRRSYRGIPLGQADREHIHHKLIDRGLSKRSVVFLLYGVNILVLVIFVQLVQRQFQFQFVVLGVLVIAGIVGLKLFGYIQFLPFAKENIDRFKSSQKRRYLSYISRKIKGRMEKSTSEAEVRSQLNLLMNEFDVGTAEIWVRGGQGEGRIFAYSMGSPGKDSMTLEIPMYVKERKVGKVCLNKKEGSGYFFAVSELAGVFQGVSADAICGVLRGVDASGSGRGTGT